MWAAKTSDTMHELPITKSIFNSVIRKAESEGAASVTRVVLEIGILRDFIPEMVQKYWDYISPGSIVEGSKIEIREVPASAECGKCGNTYLITRENISRARCPICDYEFGKLVSGSELRIVGIEIVRKQKEDLCKKLNKNGTIQTTAEPH